MNVKMMPITMDSDTLSNLKRDLDLLITQAISSMRAWNSQEGAINMKMTIKLHNVVMDDGAGGMRDVTLPVFEHKVNAIIQAKSELKGGTSAEYELVWDAQTNRYGMVKLNSNQTSLFDEADGEVSDVVGDLLELPIKGFEEETK